MIVNKTLSHILIPKSHKITCYDYSLLQGNEVLSAAKMMIIHYLKESAHFRSLWTGNPILLFLVHTNKENDNVLYTYTSTYLIPDCLLYFYDRISNQWSVSVW
jgi:hypothetical protein